MMKKAALLIGFVLLLDGCTFAISPDMVKKSDKNIRFENVVSDPDAYKGKIVIIGGVIARVKNMNRGTVIEVIQKDLDYWGKPRRTDRTGGRFLLIHPGYIDALIYSPGREITAAAEVTGTEQKALGEIEYTYAAFLAKEIRLWERERPYGTQPGFMDPLYDPYGPARQSW